MYPLSLVEKVADCVFTPQHIYIWDSGTYESCQQWIKGPFTQQV